MISNSEKIIRFCNYQERCCDDVKKKIATLKIPKNEGDKILRELLSEGYVDDNRYANIFARGKVRISRWGTIKIRQELSKKNIDGKIINKAIENIDEHDYTTALQQLLASKKRMLKNEPDKNILRQKLINFALSHGFEFDKIEKFLPK